ncbi:MAG: UbiD family decarboxylase [Chloroflexi bacterium]|nr:UbiD family decarboxylase [Chloroflexota bacterium]
MQAVETPVLGQVHYRDLREWLALVEGFGELTHVKGADWHLELGAISELNYRRKPTPALLFDEIKGHQPGFRVLTASSSSSRRLGTCLRLSTDLTDAELVEALRGRPLRWEQSAPRYAPRVVSDGPILENVREGAAVDLSLFPVPFWHEHDGGRYIGTGCSIITCDPDTGATNVGAYRCMLIDDRTISVQIIPGKHGRVHYEKWFAKEGRAPLVVALGGDPLLTILSGLEVPTGISELNYMGAIIGEPVEVLRSDLTPLPIPARSEIVLEGWIYPDKQGREGPFGEWTGYYSGSVLPSPYLEVQRLYYRHDPIMIGAPPSKPPHDYSYMRTAMKSAMIYDALVKAGVPDVRGVWAHECGGGRLWIVVSITTRFCGHSRQAGAIAAQCREAAYMNRFVVVVDDDIDPMNLEEVVWAMSTRCDPAEDIDIMRKAWGSRADPLLVDGQPPYNSRAVIDACIPYERKADFPRVAQASPALLQQIEQKWASVFAQRPAPAPGVGGPERVRALLDASPRGPSRAAELPTDMAAGEGRTTY